MRWLVIAVLMAAAVRARADLAEVRNNDDIQRAFRAGSRVRVVSLWATWCAPCVAEIGGFNDVAKSFKGSAVEFVGVSLDDAIATNRAETKEKVVRFLAGRKIAFRNVFFTGK